MEKTQNLVLIPGLMLDGRMWAGQIEGLSDLTEITVADRSKQGTLKGVADYILETAPEKFALGGLSQGGVIALEIIRRAPGRVTRLALFDTTHKPDTKAAERARLEGIQECRAGKYAEVIEGFLPHLVTKDHLKDEFLMASLRQMALDLGPAGYIREQRQMLGRAGFEDFVADISVPTAIICGEVDAFFSPEQHREMAALIPESEFHVIPGAGHMSPMENPGAVTKILQSWLRA